MTFYLVIGEDGVERNIIAEFRHDDPVAMGAILRAIADKLDPPDKREKPGNLADWSPEPPEHRT